MIKFFSGLPKSGKSVTLHGLFQEYRRQGRRFFLERVHPDQEGNWTLESPNGQDKARGIKNVLKTEGTFWSDEFVRHACRSIAGLGKTFPHVLADMGGIPSSQNEEIVKAAMTVTSVTAVILYPQGSDYSMWSDFWGKLGVAAIPLESRLSRLQYGSPAFEEEVQRLVKLSSEEKEEK